MSKESKSEMESEKKFCHCGRSATNYCPIYKLYYCRRCGCPYKRDGMRDNMRHHHEPLDHISGAMKEIMHNLWLGDRFDAEQIPNREDKNQWVLFAIVDYPNQEVPNEPVDALPYAVKFFSIFGANRDPEKYPYGSDWHEDSELSVNIQIMDQIAEEIRDALISGNKVLVHCVGGIHRSPLVTAYFMWREGYVDGIEEAYDLIISKRPEVQRRTYWLPQESRDQPKPEDFE